MSDHQQTAPGETAIDTTDKPQQSRASFISSQSASSREDKTLSTALNWASICLFGVFGVSVISNILPLELLNPQWQDKFITSIRGGASFPLEASVCMLLAATFAPRNPAIQRRWNRVRQFAGILSIIFLLFIPWQVYSGLRLLNNRVSDEYQALASLQTSARAIAASTNEAQFREALGSIPGAPPLPATSLAETLPSLKANVLQQITPQIKSLETLLERQRNRRNELFTGFAIRDSLICLFYALGFGAFAKVSLFSLPNPAKQIKLFKRSLNASLQDLRQRSEFASSSSSRRRRSDADRQREQERKREMKQHAAEQRKAHRRRQIEARIKAREQGRRS